MSKILFNDVRKTDNYTKNISMLFSDYELFRNKHFSELCKLHLNKHYKESSLFLTHSATGALEMIALLLDIKPGDEIIMPSFTYVSTANAFVSLGATPVFIDINQETLNIDDTLIELAITPKTKAVVVMHYAGLSNNLNVIKSICIKNNLFLIEDAAMAYGSKDDIKPLGTIGDFGVISFDITKHISAIQGGLLIVNNKTFAHRASNIYHIGTNREDFNSKKTAHYEWVDLGLKFQMNELSAATLYDDLLNEEKIISHRKTLSEIYYNLLSHLEEQGKLKLINKPFLKDNIHEFFLILNSTEERDALAQYLLQCNIEAYFHYIPLHSSTMGKNYKFIGSGLCSKVSECLIRLPLHNNLNLSDIHSVCKSVDHYFINNA